MADADLYLWPLFPAARGDMLIHPFYPITATPHYISLDMMRDFVGQGTQGPAGPPGTTGPQGPAGPAGPAGTGGASISVGDTPPASPTQGAGWWDSAGGQLYLWYDDGSSGQWVPTTNQPGPAGATGPAGSANMSGMTAGQIPIAASPTTVTSSGNLSGDVTTGGGLTTTLATVNSNVGSFQGLTVNAKGLVTAAANQGYLPSATAASTYAPLASPSFTGNVAMSGDTLTIGGHVTVIGETGGVTKLLSAVGQHIYLQPGTGANLYSTVAGAYKPGGGAWTDSSDIRVKRNVTDYTTGLEAVVRLRPVSFEFNGKGGTPNDGKTYVGLVANEAQEVMPEMVGKNDVEFEKGDTHLTEILTLDATALIYALVNAVKELCAKVEALEARDA